MWLASSASAHSLGREFTYYQSINLNQPKSSKSHTTRAQEKPHSSTTPPHAHGQQTPHRKATPVWGANTVTANRASVIAFAYSVSARILP